MDKNPDRLVDNRGMVPLEDDEVYIPPTLDEIKAKVQEGKSKRLN